MRANRLSKTELEELTQIMSVGNSALKRCADMLDLGYREFRGKIFEKQDRHGPVVVTVEKLETKLEQESLKRFKELTHEQLESLKAAVPLIQAVHDKCQNRILANFKKMVAKQAFLASRNNYDPENAREEFTAEGWFAVLDAVYSYTDLKTKLSTFVWRCMRRRIVAAINRMNPMCPLTNEALEIVRRVQEVKDLQPDLTDDEAVEIVGLTSDEKDVFFSAVTKVVNENVQTLDEETHDDDYTGGRRGVDRDFKEVFFIRKEARQALKDADLDDFEFACVIADTFPYHGWKEDVASKHVNPRTGERYTRQNVQYVLDRAKKRIRDVYIRPPKVHLDNPLVDKFFDEWDAERAIQEDQESRSRN